MQNSLLPGNKKAMLIAAIVFPTLFLCAFKAFNTEQEWINWGNRFLNENYDPTVEPNLKKFEITLTPDHFLRLRKTYQQGKQEYYSFSLRRFADIGYIHSSATTDTLEFKTQADDIIYQTYEDPQGDVDSMATRWDIPVKKLSAPRLDSLKQALNALKGKGL